VITALRPLAEAKGLRLEVQLPNHGLQVRTDRRALTQIMLNLMNNAIKFTESGQVRLEVRQTDANLPRTTELSVVDTGIGIKSEDQAKLFQAFQQVNGAARSRQQGTGLGLHLCQKLADLLGGHIRLHSEYGKGSTFTFVLKEK